MRRPKLAILLILALVATFFAPLRAGWACPDGTPCVAGSDRGFVCAGGQCATQKSCCEVERPVRCKHGALPGIGSPQSSGPAIQAPDHCRFSAGIDSQLVAVIDPGAKLLLFSLDALPVLVAIELTVPAASPAWRAEHTLGYRPPPTLSTGPSRAPPPA